MRTVFAGFLGATADAWQEVRVHRGRVLLSLVGVAAAVAALTLSMAVADLAKQSIVEQTEQWSGRPVTLNMSVQTPTNSVAEAERIDAAWFDTMKRADISYATREGWDNVEMRFPEGVEGVQLRVVDQQYAMLRHTRMLKGSWFKPGDTERLAPALVINRPMWERMGSPDLRTNPTVTSGDLGNSKLVVIGIVDGPTWEGAMPEAFMLHASHRAVTPDERLLAQGAVNTTYSMWIPPELAKPMMDRVKQSMVSALGKGPTVDVQRSDANGMQSSDPTETFRMLSLGIGIVILILGALGLLNIAIVSVRQRIREIGVRRSFGATTGRIFFSVMMESVVATVVAGIVGVMIAVLVMRIPAVYELFSSGGGHAPAFPVGAAMIGLVSATVVGALAGLIPAVIATRVKVIDAIRF